MRNFINKRDINGLLLFDKPIGYTSNKILQYIKFIYKAKKAGHTGTLDPLASGLLPICLGEATKFTSYLINSDKIYIVKARLGEKTNTADKDGIIIKKKKINFSQKQLNDVLSLFRGKIKQIPTMYSAIKYKGIPLYKYARAGINILLNKREVTIYKLKLLSFKKNEIKLKIHCSKGTYIRTIIDNIGDKLNCGAHVIKLRRIKLSHFSILNKNIVTIGTLDNLIKNCNNNLSNLLLIDKLLLPTDYILNNFPKLLLSKNLINNLKNGKKTKISINNTKNNNIFRIYDKYQFLGICQINNKNYIKKYKLMNI
ncbi:tRNA pseudouridine(55) synthase TruB [Enterobacteriaceae endosymbiont of Plateumaris consimilis]|uniref:tRNA pseudouridine(55) synthase TruB n=1 Tax=Enterobacteriaceae endosymbiont of Plateumaris consimilis TaxID=2675794 RepID=UPI0014493C2E|nr:tRNA pseudouridine(55) synthase TruB [Enterobacteriaceae endosymbiont of Plateumaris consimilis]QJC28714.1 tRNA pseudouridine(55) synthase TruB [Enterobacteriaceae endosymbiont of Plateumaris consimilis]